MFERLERGHCFCGAIAAEFRGEPFWICFDHDDDCRRATGAAVVVWVGYRPEQVRFLKGEPKKYSRTEGVVRTFCPDCGTSIAYEDIGIKKECYFSLGFFDRPEAFQPMAHAYWRMKLPWIEFADRLERIDGYSRTRDALLGYPSSRKKT
ncbi:MAG TPA: GFA family protein [Kiloniellaceae bacterium]|nr:GFA family protein [Kiloniellaceae bacterium]